MYYKDGWQEGNTSWQPVRLERRESTGKYYLVIQNCDLNLERVLHEEITVHDDLRAAEAYVKETEVARQYEVNARGISKKTETG